MKEQIQQLVAEGRTEDALALLAQHSSDALLLQARFSNGKKQYNMGLIEYSEWQRTQAQINYAALELASTIKGAGKPAAPGHGAGQQQHQHAPAETAAAHGSKVFISYNHQDSFAMRSVKGFLEDHGIKVHVDISDMSAGESIQGFIDEAFKNNDFVISVVSRNSLLSGWVNKELTVAQVLNQFNNNWIPVSIDDAAFNKDFFFEANEGIDRKISDLRGQVKKALDSELDIAPFTDELKRLQDLKASLASTLSNLKNLLVIDISGKAFDSGMLKVVDRLKGKK
ncbi:MAG: toll/interleukin-1 receptor domain-containing protein [Saprospirales bacterium]|nr:toll/interleukin-1 receptor domain-containing protein [Saprospirales bacterium]